MRNRIRASELFDTKFYRASGPAQRAKAKLVRDVDDFVVLARYTGRNLMGERAWTFWDTRFDGSAISTGAGGAIARGAGTEVSPIMGEHLSPNVEGAEFGRPCACGSWNMTPALPGRRAESPRNTGF